MNSAFHQFNIDDQIKDLFKFTTPFGLYRYNHVVMGTPPASPECHGKMEMILRGLEGCCQIKNDVLIYGKGEEHDKRLEAVLQRFKEYGLTLNTGKCEIGKREAEWFGHMFSKTGMSADPKKVLQIKE